MDCRHLVGCLAVNILLLSSCLTPDRRERRLPEKAQGSKQDPGQEQTEPKLPTEQTAKKDESVTGGSSGCNKGAPETGIQTVTIKLGKVERSFIRVVNENYRQNFKHPLVIGYHGLGLDGNSPRKDHKWPIIEQKAGDNAIFIYANSRGSSWNGGSNSEDIQFFDAIVKSTGDLFCLDPKRVFVHGFSNGAFFVNQLVQQKKDAIRGVISVAGGGSGTDIAAMVIHGEADPNVGFGYAPGLLTSYLNANNCRDELINSPREACTYAKDCDFSKPVAFCPWSGNHHWPEFTLPYVWEFIESLK